MGVVGGILILSYYSVVAGLDAGLRRQERDGGVCRRNACGCWCREFDGFVGDWRQVGSRTRFSWLWRFLLSPEESNVVSNRR